MKTYLLLSISVTLIVVLSYQFGRMIERYRVNKALQPTLERMRRIAKKIKEHEGSTHTQKSTRDTGE